MAPQRSRMSTWQGTLLLFAMLFSLAPRPVSAATEYNETISFTDEFTGCSGELVLVSGEQRILGRVTKDGLGRWHFGFTRHMHGTGIGQVSGDAYLLSDAVARSSLEFTSGEVKVYTEQYSARLLHRGEDAWEDDAFVHFVSKITITPEGNVTSLVEIQNAECR